MTGRTGILWGEGGEAAAAQHVEVAVLERGQPVDVLAQNLVTFGAEPVDGGGVDVPHRPEHHGIEDQASASYRLPRP
ncbi:hypothetical protein OG798_52035 [Streptomyces sp. NBC_00271]|nr:MULTISPECIES: hypothetical protein [Streptomyces]